MTSAGAKRWSWVWIAFAGLSMLASILLDFWGAQVSGTVSTSLVIAVLFTLRSDLLEFIESERSRK